MTLDVWIIDELEREPDGEDRRPRPELDLERPDPDPESPSCTAVQRGVRILDISPSHENVLDL